MRLLFLVPPVDFNPKGIPDRTYGCNYGFGYTPPVHLLSQATVAQQLGHEVRLMDCRAENINTDAFLNFIRTNAFDWVYFFTVYLSNEDDLKAAKMIGEFYPETKFVFAGTSPTWKPEMFLYDLRYVVIRGEPEGTIQELFSTKNPDFQNICGISYLKNGEVHHNKARGFVNLDTLPLPDRRLYKGLYRINRLNVFPITNMCVSRGCAFRCKFCAPNAIDQAIEIEYKKGQVKYTNRPPLRLRSVEHVIEEFKDIAKLGYKGVEICDNQFIWGKERTLEICQGIKGLGLQWICLARAAAMHDKEILKAMREAGCQLVYMGTESFRQAILDDIRKEMKAEDIKIAVNALRECGIEPEISVIMGASPLETKEDIAYSLREANKLNTRFTHFGIILPFPNTEYYDIVKANRWFTTPTNDFMPVDNSREAIISLPNVSGEEMKKFLKKAYFYQYCRPQKIIRQILKIRSAGDCLHKATTFLKFLKMLMSKS